MAKPSRRVSSVRLSARPVRVLVLIGLVAAAGLQTTRAGRQADPWQCLDLSTPPPELRATWAGSGRRSDSTTGGRRERGGVAATTRGYPGGLASPPRSLAAAAGASGDATVVAGTGRGLRAASLDVELAPGARRASTSSCRPATVRLGRDRRLLLPGGLRRFESRPARAERLRLSARQARDRRAVRGAVSGCPPAGRRIVLSRGGRRAAAAALVPRLRRRECPHPPRAAEEVDPGRIGIVGHSYGGKWALFAGALYERFAAVGVVGPRDRVRREARPNVNYWEPWYLGASPARSRRVAC